jgi:uncharacterized protein (TIGR03437 family)
VTFSLTATAPSTLFTVINQVGTAGFVSKLSADGSSLAYSTYVRAHATLAVPTTLAAEPNAFYQENWISGLALDSAGNVVVAGGTRGLDLVTQYPSAPAHSGGSDAFAATIAADGSRFLNSTYFGGSKDDGALAAAVDPNGNAIFAGQTFSGDFPGSGPSTLPYTYGDAFVVKLATGTPVISSVLNGASFQPGIESGSWAMIKGVNLAPTTRVWGDADFTGDRLPTSLTGVTVTVDGKPAYVYYISPTQINVQVPDDSALGNVQVVVDNNGIFSAPAFVPLQTYAPAFFMDLGTDYVIASKLPNYTVVGTPSAPAHPGDTLVFWATGFGPTTPAQPAGTKASTSFVSFTNTQPSITIGGVQVQPISSTLTPGSAGVYQIALTLPANVPTGTVTLQASIAGIATPPVSLVIQ